MITFCLFLEEFSFHADESDSLRKLLAKKNFVLLRYLNLYLSMRRMKWNKEHEFVKRKDSIADERK